MEIELKMRPSKTLTVPFNYHYQLQSSIYALLGTVNEADFWHDIGFGDISKYKGFCFSGLKGSYHTDAVNKKLIYDGNVYLEVRSPVFEFCDAFQRAVEKHPFITLFDTRLDIIGASLSNTHFDNGITRLRAITPVVVHTTLADGHTVFFSPDEDEFYYGICDNIEKKYTAIMNAAPGEVLIRTSGEMKKSVTKYKNMWITGYTGLFEIKTTFRMAEFIYASGLGEKNSQGFGFTVQH